MSKKAELRYIVIVTKDRRVMGLMLVALASCSSEPKVPIAVDDLPRPPYIMERVDPELFAAHPNGGGAGGYRKLLERRAELARAAADEVVRSLQKRDMIAVANWVHPVYGVRFSQSGQVRWQSDLIWKARDIPGWFDDPRVYLWGSEVDACTGAYKLIEMTPVDYFDNHLFDRDFVVGEITEVGEILTPEVVGGEYGFSYEIYGGLTVVQVQHPRGTPRVAGDPQIDIPPHEWRSLKLVFTGLTGPGAPEDLEVRLVGIVLGLRWGCPR